jgi:DNA-binding MltR family transcriptional regulator
VIVTTAVVPLMKVVGPVGAIVVALAIVDALAVVAVMPKTAKAALTRRI